MEHIGRPSPNEQQELNTHNEYVLLPGRESNLKLRWRAYETVPGNSSFKPDMYEAMNIEPGSTIVDVGCNEAEDLVNLRQRGFIGRLIGVEIDTRLIKYTKDKPEVKSSNIEFRVGVAEQLPFESNSVDHVTALFMLYHSPNPDAAIREMHRILKPGGTLAIATSSSSTKTMHRAFEVRIADYLGLSLPSRFNDSFTTRDLEKYLGIPESVNNDIRIHTSTSDLFENIKYFRLNDRMRFDSKNYFLYLGSLSSMFGRDLVESGKFSPAINDKVMPVIEDDIDRYGVFSDIADRSWAVMTKRQPNKLNKSSTFILNALNRNK